MAGNKGGDQVELKRGPWTNEEDSLLANYVKIHGERNWKTVARCAGLRRSGKSCRLRWLNYLSPDVRRGNITLQEQLLILQLQSLWGNRWSKIAQQLPGRTDNEIKNYWRTRVQKQAKHLNCDTNSQKFRDAMRYEWIPRLMERVRAASGSSDDNDGPAACCSSPFTPTVDYAGSGCTSTHHHHHRALPPHVTRDIVPANLSGTSPDSLGTQMSELTDCCYNLWGTPGNIGSKSCNDSWLDSGYNSLLWEDCFLPNDDNAWFV